ncbi:MAG: hypothetical protein RIR20_691 [Pseudomonadota bacterium]|jgi:hypothetical protein
MNSDLITFDNFVRDSSAQSLGKFGEFLFSKFCDYKNIRHLSKHKGGVDFVIDTDLLIDVKAVRHIKYEHRARFRRHNIDKQLPDVHYAYIIFWKDSIELRVEKNDVKFGSYDCFLDENFVSSVWSGFDKKSIKFLDKNHVENANSLKKNLAVWIADNLGIRARVIQRKASANLNKRSGGWGADNFYCEPPHKHEIVVLLGVANGVVEYIHSYPTSEYLSIEVRPKPVGTNRKKILCYFVDKLANRYKFKDILDFKENVKDRFFV